MHNLNLTVTELLSKVVMPLYSPECGIPVSLLFSVLPKSLFGWTLKLLSVDENETVSHCGFNLPFPDG